MPSGTSLGVPCFESLRAILPLLYNQTLNRIRYLKNPPAGYPEPAIDVVAQLDNITAKLQNAEYNNEYEVQLDIATTFTRAHDGHFYFLPDILGVIAFSRDESLQLVSVSTDGVRLPEVYVYGMHNFVCRKDPLSASPGC